MYCVILCLLFIHIYNETFLNMSGRVAPDSVRCFKCNPIHMRCFQMQSYTHALLSNAILYTCAGFQMQSYTHALDFKCNPIHMRCFQMQSYTHALLLNAILYTCAAFKCNPIHMRRHITKPEGPLYCTVSFLFLKGFFVV